MDLGLAGKRALVLGSSRGLGFAVADALAAEGARVVIASRSEAAISSAAADIAGRHGVEVIGRVCDVARLSQVDALADAALTDLGGVDILVNNTGGPPAGPISQVPLATWEDMFRTMVVSVIHITSRLLPGMRERKWGRVLMMTSTGVKQPIPVLGISNTLRASLMNWAKTISLEVAADGVTVNMIMPGRIKTDRTRELDGLRAEREGRPIEEIQAESCAQIPIGRYGTVEEFAAVAAFLASERASYVTGIGLAVDGGLIKAS